MSNEFPSVLSLILWDLRAQIESQLRRIADAQRYWEASHNGAEAASVARTLVCIEEIIEATKTVRDSSAEARVELVRLAPEDT